MNSITLNNHLLTLKTVSVAARIFLSSLFIASIVATLFCAYLQQANASVIFVCLGIGSLHGIYSIFSIYRGVGFDKYTKTAEKLDAGT